MIQLYSLTYTFIQHLTLNIFDLLLLEAICKTFFSLLPYIHFEIDLCSNRKTFKLFYIIGTIKVMKIKIFHLYLNVWRYSTLKSVYINKHWLIRDGFLMILNIKSCYLLIISSLMIFMLSHIWNALPAGKKKLKSIVLNEIFFEIISKTTKKCLSKYNAKLNII